MAHHQQQMQQHGVPAPEMHAGQHSVPVPEMHAGQHGVPVPEMHAGQHHYIDPNQYHYPEYNHHSYNWKWTLVKARIRIKSVVELIFIRNLLYSNYKYFIIVIYHNFLLVKKYLLFKLNGVFYCRHGGCLLYSYHEYFTIIIHHKFLVVKKYLLFKQNDCCILMSCINHVSILGHMQSLYQHTPKEFILW